jgi:hypothetical protein
MTTTPDPPDPREPPPPPAPAPLTYCEGHTHRWDLATGDTCNCGLLYLVRRDDGGFAVVIRW